MSIPNVAKTLGATKPNKNVTRAAGLEVFELARRRHPHLEQEEAEHSLEETDEEVIVLASDLLALHAADEADHDSAEQQVETRYSETLRGAACAEKMLCLLFTVCR